MKFFRFFKKNKVDKETARKILREKYSYFESLLNTNNSVLSIMADMEEKLSGEYLFDINYIKDSVQALYNGVMKIIDNLNALSDNKYLSLQQVYEEIRNKIEKTLSSTIEIPVTDFVIPLEELQRDSISIAGGKNAHLAELKNILKIPVPDGFIITSYAFLRFIEYNRLKDRITDVLNRVNINDIESLEQCSKEIKEMIINAEIPPELENAIKEGYENLCKKLNKTTTVSVRSSAIHEDSDFSFAGQYSSFLNVKEEHITQKYKEVVASLFNTRAIFYYKTKGFSENDMVMAVGVLSMVNAKAGGVIYSKNPNNPESENIIVNAVRGLGKLIVDGSVAAETYVIKKNPEISIVERIPGKQDKMLICHKDGGIEEVSLPQRNGNVFLSDEIVLELARLAVKIERYYEMPQDIEWAIDEEDNIFILQTRNLRVLKPEAKIFLPTRIKNHKILINKGISACKGIGYGKAFVLSNESQLQDFPQGWVLVAKHTNPKYVIIMNKASAIITDVGSPTGHMASLSREYNIPTILNVENATKIITHEQEITVDAFNCVVYEGKVDELLEIAKKIKEPFRETKIYKLLQRVLKYIAPLNLVDPSSEEFKPDNCKTFHDITRFCHEMVMHEMFTMWDKYEYSEIHAIPLITGIPIAILVLDIEGGLREGINKASYEDVFSIPLRAILRGMKSMQWPGPPPVDAKGVLGMIAHTVSIPEEELRETAKKSFCIVTKNYMNFSIRLGYHFSMIEAYAGNNLNDNYIKFFFKGGGAALERRLRRVRLISEILTKMGFRVFTKEDVIDAILTKYDIPKIENMLEVLGKLTAYTKQLDMVLFNDAVTQMYIDEFLKKHLKEN